VSRPQPKIADNLKGRITPPSKENSSRQLEKSKYQGRGWKLINQIRVIEAGA
jgi:hypothetical protein